MGTPGRDGQTRTTIALANIGGIDRIDFLDEADKVIISARVALDAHGNFNLTAPWIADHAAQAAENAMRKLIATIGGALLTFYTMSVLGWMAAQGRFTPRRAAQRRGKTDGGIRHQSLCDKAWADRVTMGLIVSAVHALDHPNDQDRYREEWAADSGEIPGEWQRLRWALLLRLCAPIGIRSARRDALSMSPQQQQ